jgi:2,3-bisphosphoglycerate-dependent phosphoglycerate mutase
MTEVLVVRHARTADGEFANRERPLSEEGKQQARALADRLVGQGIQAIYTSPFRRAIETVGPLVEATGSEARVDEDLRESSEDEALLAVRQRMVSAVQDIVDRHVGKRIVVCTHGGTLWGLISHFDAEFGYDQYRQLGSPDVKRFLYGPDGARFDADYQLRL